MKLRRPQNVHPCGSNQPPSGGCVLKLSAARKPAPTTPPAAFGRLCVETNRKIRSRSNRPQPPSGGCVLKPITADAFGNGLVQPPSGGCVLKHAFGGDCPQSALQPPSGGCVLKLIFRHFVGGYYIQPPSGGCVLKQRCAQAASAGGQPAAFGRLCVETRESISMSVDDKASRLRAAVC